jgi:hypothetical protein
MPRCAFAGLSLAFLLRSSSQFGGALFLWIVRIDYGWFERLDEIEKSSKRCSTPGYLSVVLCLARGGSKICRRIFALHIVRDTFPNSRVELMEVLSPPFYIKLPDYTTLGYSNCSRSPSPNSPKYISIRNMAYVLGIRMEDSGRAIMLKSSIIQHSTTFDPTSIQVTDSSCATTHPYSVTNSSTGPHMFPLGGTVGITD